MLLIKKSRARDIVVAIDRYIRKTEEDEESELQEIGYPEAAGPRGARSIFL